MGDAVELRLLRPVFAARKGITLCGRVVVEYHPSGRAVWRGETVSPAVGWFGLVAETLVAVLPRAVSLRERRPSRVRLLRRTCAP